MNLEDISIHAWIQEHQIKTEKGLPINFNEHFFLFDPYTDFTPTQVILKAAQIGLSSLEILKAFYIAKKKGVDIIYTLPTDADVSVFVGGKVNRFIRQNPILQSYTQDKDSVEQKKVGEGMIYYRGTFTKRAAISVTADVLIHDEVDFSDQEIIGDYESRLQHSQYKYKWYFGHPSAQGIGVSAIWENSDQKHWFIKCKGCGKEQYLSWPESINQEKQVFQCKHCFKELTQEERRIGRWVKKFKDRKISGYWISLLMASWITAKEIIEKFNTSTEEFFWNRVLGLPYVGSGNKVNEQDILQNLTEEVNEQKGRIVIGVDTGEWLRFVVGNQNGLFYYGQTKEYKDIESLLDRFSMSIAVFDAGGDIIGSRQIREKYAGRVFLCHYSQDRKTMQLIRWGENDEAGNVIVDRNRVIQLVIDEFKSKRIPLQGTTADWWDYWLHWSHIYRVEEEDNLEVPKRRWMRSGRDDWVHATVYWRVGMDKFGKGQGIIISSSELNIKESFEVPPDNRVKFPSIKKLIMPEKQNDWRKT
jgi:hypothetical protein